MSRSPSITKWIVDETLNTDNNLFLVGITYMPWISLNSHQNKSFHFANIDKKFYPFHSKITKAKKSN